MVKIMGSGRRRKLWKKGGYKVNHNYNMPKNRSKIKAARNMGKIKHSKEIEHHG